MEKMKIEQGDWVVVCDGGKALILENVGDDMFPNLQVREVHEHDDAKTHEQGTDKPGRTFNSVGQGRSAVEQTDWHDEAERVFLQDLAGRLDAALGAAETKSLVVVASPRALGMLRATYSPAVKKAIRNEFSKDLIKLPVHEIEKHLVGSIA
jgi:protein required for attachment to host cells